MAGFARSIPRRRAIARRVGLVVTGSVLAAFILPLLSPFPKREEGLTLCYPVVGPVERFNPDLSNSALARARAHEDAHAAQCRRDGALWHFVRGAFPSKRLAAEAEAYCAEAKFGISKGGAARLEYARIQDELREMVWFRRLSSDALNDSLAAACPMVAVTAAREEADWRARRHGSDPR
jgi:hypothetical protein